MGRRWHAGREAPDRCGVHGKSVHAGRAGATAAARDVERRDGLEPGAMAAFWCESARGWHIGHNSIRTRLTRD